MVSFATQLVCFTLHRPCPSLGSALSRVLRFPAAWATNLPEEQRRQLHELVTARQQVSGMRRSAQHTRAGCVPCVCAYLAAQMQPSMQHSCVLLPCFQPGASVPGTSGFAALTCPTFCAGPWHCCQQPAPCPGRSRAGRTRSARWCRRRRRRRRLGGGGSCSPRLRVWRVLCQAPGGAVPALPAPGVLRCVR